MAKNKKRDEVYSIREIYMQMELDLINSMRRNLSRHRKEEAKQGFKFEHWQAAKLRDLERFRRENIQIIGHYFKEVEELIKETLVETYRESQNNVNEFIKEIKNTYVDDAPTPKDETFFRTNDKKFDSLMETIEKDFNKANSAVFRRMDDIYRQTIFKAQIPYSTGIVTLDQAIDSATKDFLEKGIDAITYADGKKVNIASYAEMALRTANHRAYLMAEGKKRQEMGNPLVVVSAHATACELCVPWQGLILIDDVYSGGKKEDGPYPLLSEAMEAGFLHPQCRHNLSTYFPGITALPKVPDKEKALENYEKEQKQRVLERAIRRQKRKVAGTIDKDSLKVEKDNLKNLQEEMRNHLEENPQLRRAYRREKPGPGISNKDLKTHEELLNQKAIDDKIKETREYINSNDCVKNIIEGRQGKHILGHNNYEGKSYLLDGVDPQELVNKYAGTGELKFSKTKIEWTKKEFITSKENIGVNVDLDTGEEALTNYFSISYSKKGTHIVPRKPKKEGNND
ncbi:capsid protein [Clostridium sp. D2Q-14]|uniref:phage minor capsid protein n=1 Tax=Anaeromonas gelatinilytica TaxID=2683194 RepID=UPI00193BA984|nr:phage minor capsid protein [Anaeromonas gelatinilytica]MBS4534987.1 capsid protein [Anaeromonas gelatinilytica]